MTSTNRIIFIVTIISISTLGKAALGAEDLFVQHSKMMVRAIQAIDLFKVKALLATPYIDPNGVSEGMRAQYPYYLDFAMARISSGRAEVKDIVLALLKAGARKTQPASPSECAKERTGLAMAFAFNELQRGYNSNVPNLDKNIIAVIKALVDHGADTLKYTKAPSGCADTRIVPHRFAVMTDKKGCRTINRKSFEILSSLGSDPNYSNHYGNVSFFLKYNSSCVDPKSVQYLKDVGVDVRGVFPELSPKLEGFSIENGHRKG